MLQNLTIEEASLLFCSHYYQNLKCKIVEKGTSSTICCRLINNCIQTNFSINRELQHFNVLLYQDSNLVAVFDFTSQDVENVLNQGENELIMRNKRRKYIKLKKQNDCCSLYFTIEAKNIIRADDFHDSDEFVYEDFVRNIANKVYKKLEIRAINRIKNIQASKLHNKRLSLEYTDSCQKQIIKVICQGNIKKEAEPSTFVKPTTSILKILSNRSDNLDFNHICKKNKNSNSCSENLSKFSQSWMGEGLMRYDSVHREKSYHDFKLEYKLKKIKQRSQKKKEQKKQYGYDLVVIPEVTQKKMVKNMRLISDGLVIPKRIKSQNIEEYGVKLSGHFQIKQSMYRFQSDNVIGLLSKIRYFSQIAEKNDTNWTYERKNKNDSRININSMINQSYSKNSSSLINKNKKMLIKSNINLKKSNSSKDSECKFNKSIIFRKRQSLV